ncbi:MAG: TonB-dependent receptor [Spirochaetales bacterium]|nr:TonB-dependent receptor [Spirochaetales bacterium]
MKKSVLTTLLLNLALLLSAQTLDGDITETVVSGIEEVARKMIGTSFTPMTGYDKGDYQITSAAGFTLVNALGSDVEGDGLYGYSGGIGGGYALTDRVLVYTIVNGLFVDGTVEAPFLGDGYDDSGAALSLTMADLFVGAGYDVLSHPHFSLPLFAGMHAAWYDYSGDLDDSDVLSGTVDGVISGSGLTPGFSGGAAAEYKKNRFSLGAYYIFMVDFYGVEGEADFSYDSESISGSETDDFRTPSYYGGTYGLYTGFKPGKNWAFSLNLSDLLSFVKEDEAELMTLALSVSYYK